MAPSLLALHPDKQEWVYNSIKSIVDDRIPTFHDYNDLKDVLACFSEALRMYSTAYLTSRVASKDLTPLIPRRNKPEVTEQLFVKKGTSVNLDAYVFLFVFLGVLNRQTFPDPEAFDPELWVKPGKSEISSSITKDTEAGQVCGSSPASSLDGFVGLSFGPRTCFSYEFAKIEAVASFALLLREWRVEVALREGETKREWKERVLKMTMTVGDVPLKLFRRK